MSQSPSTRDLRAKVVETLLTVSGLSDSNLIFLNPQQPSSTMDKSFTVNIFQSRNTGKFRDRDSLRQEHTVQVTLVHIVKPLEQVASLETALDDTDSIIRVMMTYVPLENIARVAYSGTTRSLTSSGDYIFTTFLFSLESDLTLF